ncbi:unnamed protein product [Brachionus calyciflorus]|uniref:Tudor domain-containing protein n=1 Tax=Brachionus calyciflorus TaxID=104777 RepID=A0A813MD10_9BILA|nr:unnamed protein product [Brachionus calyciflorus]
MEALPNDNSLSGASKKTDKDENNNPLNNCTDKILTDPQSNFINIDENLIKNEKCSSCGQEAATLICTGCTSQAKTTNLDSIPALKIYSPTDELKLDDYYNLNDENNVQNMLKNGHMIYCKDCFEIIHLTLDASKHIPLEINPKSNTEILNEEIELIVEDKLDDLLEQIELNSQLEEQEFNIQKYQTDILSLVRRSSQFNDVKLSIRQMNDIIRDDLHLDFGQIANLMQNKLDEISDRIKEKLKDAYSVVRDLQNKINEKINAVESNIKQLEKLRHESFLKQQDINLKESEIATQIQQLNDELKSICDPNFNFNSCYNSTFSCSLFVDNNLYPQFNYHVDLSKVIEAINELNVHIGPNLQEPKPWTYHDQMYLDPEFEFDALINSGIQTDGSFWIQFLAPSENTENALITFKKNKIRSNQFIEEISRFIRSKIISDKEWLSYDQLKQSPQQGDRCFCLDSKSRKWYRAKILKVDDNLKKCHVLYVDTGFSDLNNLHSFEDILPWRDFDLANLPNRSIKCLLYNKNSDSKYEEHIYQESKFLFKDLTSGQAIKCVLIEPTLIKDLEEAWICKIYKINEETNKKNQFISINNKILELNKKEKMPSKETVKFSCVDIRLNKMSKSSSSSSSFAPTNNPNSTIVNECKDKFNKVSQKPVDTQEIFSISESKETEEKLIVPDEPFDTNLDYSSVLNVEDTHEENIDVEDQISERRFYKMSSGTCHVTTSVSTQGIFWIRPFIKPSLNEEFEKLSKLIGDFIRRTNYRSFGDLKIEPEIYKKCFVKCTLKKNSEPGWFRGFIEKTFKDKEMCRVRLMDNGYSRELSYNDIYPHRRLDLNSLHNPREKDAFNDTDNHGLKLNYLGIRCCLFQNSNYNNLNINRDFFNSLVNYKHIHFNLVEQVYIGRIKCWYTEISCDNELINKKIFNMLKDSEQNMIKKSKSENMVRNIISENEKSSSIPTSNTNREWIRIESNQVMSHIPPRSNSAYDIKDTLSHEVDTLDDTNRSIKVKSDIQSIDESKKDTSIKISEPQQIEKEKKNYKQKNRKNKAKSLPYKEGKQTLPQPEFKSLLQPEKGQYESLSPFINEPEWEVNSNYVVNQPEFVTSKLNTIPEANQSKESNSEKKQPENQNKNYKKKKSNFNQCRPNGNNFFNWNNRKDDGSDRGNPYGGQGHGSQNTWKGCGGNNNQNDRHQQNNNTNNSYRGGRNHMIENLDDEQSSSQFNDVFLNNNDDSSLDQDDLEFDLTNENRLMNNMNSSPNSPYQKLFKINPQVNSYEQVLSRISENDSIKNLKPDNFEEAEKIRSLNLTQNLKDQQDNNIENYDTSLDSMPRLIIEDDDENIQMDPVQGTTLDQTHQIPNRHIINDLETNRSIKFDQKINQNYKNRSYSAADVGLVERHRLNLRPIQSSSSSESTTSSSLSDLKKKIVDMNDDEEESFASCPEEIKNEREELNMKKSNLKANLNLSEKLEKMKKFTISIFVDDFEADSSKTSSNESTSTLSLSPDIENSRLNHNVYTVRSVCEEKKSLEEFEKNEFVHSFRPLGPSSLDEDVFMFTSNPVHATQNRPVLASKPPLVPSHNHLSTIIELSHECSNNTENDSKKISSMEETRTNWISEIDSNSNEFQKKIDFFSKNPNEESFEIDLKNVTFRKIKNYDTLNETRKSRSISSLSDNGQMVQSLSNNCLVTESYHLSTRINVTLESSFNSRQRNNSLNNSVMVTDQLFEKFCIKENDEIMSEADEMNQSKFVRNNSEKFKIQSKILNELLDEPFTSSSISSLPQRSSSSPDISSYTTDSLFNSHLIITPIGSELVSPNHPGSIISRSPLFSSNQHSTPQNQKNSSLKSPMSQSSQSSSLPPPPPATSTKDELNDSALPPPPPSSFPPAPHFTLIKKDKSPFIENIASKFNDNTEQKKKLEIKSAPVSASNSAQNLTDVNETENLKVNKHIDNYLESVKKSTGVDLEPIRRRTNSVNKIQNSSRFQSANFSLYGLDNEDEQETKRRSLSECDSVDAKSSVPKIFPSLTDLSEPENHNDEPDSFKFPPPPEQFLNSTQTSENSILPPPPEQKELDALISPEINNQISSSSSVTTVIPVKNESPRLRTFMKSIQNLDQKLNDSFVSLPAPPIQENQNLNSSCPNLNGKFEESKKPFKLDHLLDINPKRLYKNSKFRCRIHDVISENGKFWIEVIYNEEDERKFHEIFKLFNLASRISTAPKLIYKNQRIAALYKGDWYRGLVLEDYGQISNKVKVRFLDLGLEKLLDKQTDLREVDDKFFNCPLKALHCSIYIDENIDQIVMNNKLKINEKLHFGKEARKYFVKMVYKKILYAKVIDFGEEFDLESRNYKSICKIKLGCQAHHGVIDVYMYLLSKFDREKYEFLKELKNYIQSKPMLMSIQQESIETTTITTTQTTSNTVTSTSITGPASVLPSPPDSLNATIKKFENLEEEEDDESDQSDEETSHIENQDDEDIVDQEEDYEENEEDDDDDDVLFSDAVNYYYSKNYLQKDNSLDLTPVKDNKYNYPSLKFSPVDLPDNVTPVDKNPVNNDFSTTKISNRLRATANSPRAPVTPIALPPANFMSQKYIKVMKKAQNINSDPDISLNVPCCNLNGLKKWARSSKNLSSEKYEAYGKEGFKDSLNYSVNNKTVTSKKVKFHIK